MTAWLWSFALLATVNITSAVIASRTSHFRVWFFILLWGQISAYYCVTSVLLLAYGHTGEGIFSAALAGLTGWRCHDHWKRRPPRKRKPSRVAGLVRVIEGRLKTVPT